MHHIINDDFSQEFFIKEFINIYEGVSLPPLKIRYKDFSIWQNNLVRSGAVKKQEEYWLEVFKGEIPVLNFPTDFQRPAIQTFEGESLNWRFDKIITGTINSIAKETGATLYMVLLAIYNILLSKYSGQEEIIVGTPTVGRPHTDLQHVVGMFANTVAMRNYPRGEKSFLEFIEEVKRNSVNAFENQDYQFEELIQKLGIKPDPGRQPLFETMFTTVQAANVAINLENPVPDVKESFFKPYDFGENVTQFDIIIHASKQQETIHFYTRFSTKLFKKRTIEKLFENYEKIVRCLAVNRHIKLREIKIAQTFSDASSSIMAEAERDFAF